MYLSVSVCMQGVREERGFRRKGNSSLPATARMYGKHLTSIITHGCVTVCVHVYVCEFKQMVLKACMSVYTYIVYLNLFVLKI